MKKNLNYETRRTVTKKLRAYYQFDKENDLLTDRQLIEKCKDGEAFNWLLLEAKLENFLKRVKKEFTCA